MTREELERWLAGITCTRPFTCADARELFDLIHGALGKAVVDVYTTSGREVHVRVEVDRQYTIRCAFAIV